MLARLRQKTDRTIRLHLASMRIDSQKQHREILAAVESKDLEKAVCALSNHLFYTSNDLQSFMRTEQAARRRNG
jgi:DNA-binding GntR family transcriptional regulator